MLYSDNVLLIHCNKLSTTQFTGDSKNINLEFETSFEWQYICNTLKFIGLIKDWRTFIIDLHILIDVYIWFMKTYHVHFHGYFKRRKITMFENQSRFSLNKICFVSVWLILRRGLYFKLSLISKSSSLARSPFVFFNQSRRFIDPFTGSILLSVSLRTHHTWLPKLDMAPVE